MTRDEAKWVLELIRDRYSSVDVDRLSLTDAETDAINMAIEALLDKTHGKWEMIDLCEPIRYGCSNCKILSWDTYNYCPNCGAKMDEREEEDE